MFGGARSRWQVPSKLHNINIMRSKNRLSFHHFDRIPRVQKCGDLFSSYRVSFLSEKYLNFIVVLATELDNLGCVLQNHLASG